MQETRFPSLVHWIAHHGGMTQARKALKVHLLDKDSAWVFEEEGLSTADKTTRKVLYHAFKASRDWRVFTCHKHLRPDIGRPKKGMKREYLADMHREQIIRRMIRQGFSKEMIHKVTEARPEVINRIKHEITMQAESDMQAGCETPSKTRS